MSHSAVPGHPGASALRGWHLAALGAVFAVLVQLWGLYRVAGPPQPPWFPFADKVEHAVGFAVPVLFILLAIALRGSMSWQWPNMRTGVFVVAIFAAHGVVSELVQHQWYRYRTGDPLDVLADWVGIAVGMLLIRLILLRRSRAVESLATL
ncbi:MAG TPA: VanZ family protein [Propionibacteriaceae bacterium]|nr:VanZ family protein [Propionibacteriaceae bacterium]